MTNALAWNRELTMSDDDPFQLQNEPPKPKPTEFTDNDGRQRVLFSGLNCLPGQQNLFPTDGGDDEPRCDDLDRGA
jgi:hypothetical protein